MDTRLVKCKMVFPLFQTRCNKSWIFDSETLCSLPDSAPYIERLQLPTGAAHPFITEIEESFWGHDMGWELIVDAVLVSRHTYILHWEKWIIPTLGIWVGKWMDI